MVVSSLAMERNLAVTGLAGHIRPEQTALHGGFVRSSAEAVEVRPGAFHLAIATAGRICVVDIRQHV
jgi:hypothetical protein